ncbi:MAG TPA: response regulator transcription factor [Acidimicrobiales bacterium]|jgi:DNA-binding NarL/FixJ family response regulator|nr:response regulator transcription factor [Acidimicrobiales bacterium]
MAEPEDTTVGVLIVDDHRVFSESLARLLADEDGITVLGVAGTGADAIEMVARLHPKVVLMDYQLPDQDGVSVAAQIRRQSAQVMVVMLTGSTEDRVLLAAIDAGCSGFLTKDRAAAEVVHAVRAAAVGEALISPALLARLLPKLNRTQRTLGEDLSEREREILGFLARGMTNKVIAAELFLSVNTIRNHVQSVLAKLGAHSKLEAVSTAVREGIIDYPTAGNG